MYADESSIGGEYDPDMTCLKQAPGSSRTNSAESGLSAAEKKARSVSGLKTIFLEENSGDR
jgi:hypothetical protein